MGMMKEVAMIIEESLACAEPEMDAADAIRAYCLEHEISNGICEFAVRAAKTYPAQGVGQCQIKKAN